MEMRNENIQHTEHFESRQKNTKAHCYNRNIRKSIFSEHRKWPLIYLHKRQTMNINRCQNICIEIVNVLWTATNSLFPIVLIPITESSVGFSFRFFDAWNILLHRRCWSSIITHSKCFWYENENGNDKTFCILRWSVLLHRWFDVIHKQTD